MKKIYICILLSIFVCTAVASETAFSAKEWIAINQKIIQLQGDAQAAFTRGQYEQAVALYDQILGYNPDDAQALAQRETSKRAVAVTKKIAHFYAQTQYPQTMQAVDTLKEINPADAAFDSYKERAAAILEHTKTAQQLFTQSRYAESVDQYAAVLKINPDDQGAQSDLDAIQRIIAKRDTAMQGFMNGNYDEALATYKDILAQNADDSSASRNIELCTRIQELIMKADNSLGHADFTTAFGYLKKVTELNPHDTTIQKRTVDYKKIIDYAALNKKLLAASLYPETLYNYDLMLTILPRNERLSKERSRVAQALTEKDKGYALFASENYTEALAAHKKVCDLNPADSLLSRNIAIITSAVQLKNQALTAYKNGQYTRSLDIYKTLTDIKLIADNRALPEWIVYRGQSNTVSLPIADTIIGSKPALPWTQTATGWSAELEIPYAALVGYSVVWIEIQTASSGTQTLAMPYRVEDKAPSVPVGYVEQEKDVQL